MPHLPRLKSVLLASLLTALTLSPAWAKEKFKVITTFTIIADMASNVAGDAADVSSITKPGAEIHEYQPTPGDIKRAQGAQLILSNGTLVYPLLPTSVRRTGSDGLKRRKTDGHQRRAIQWKTQSACLDVSRQCTDLRG